MIEQINDIAHLWWSVTIAMFWQVSVLIVLIGCIDLMIRRWAWPQLRYALWLMVLIKLVLPPTISLSTSVTSRLQPLAKQIVTKEDRHENLSMATALILARFESSLADASSSRDTLTEQQSAPLFADSENAVGESPNAAHVKPTWQAYAMAVWMAGMFILGGWLILKLLHLRKEDRRLPATASLPESFYNSMARCAKTLELRQSPKVILTRRVACPAVFGMVRPVLLMPTGYLSKMTHRDIEHVLLHELAHIKRGDLWVHGFYMLLQVVYWYNPLLWLVRSQMHHLRELCCDATVARLLKEKISEYRQTLIDVARRFLAKSTEPGLGLLGLFEDSNRLLVRLNWLKKETWRYQKMKKLTVITTIVLMVAFVLPMAAAQDKSPTEVSPTGSVQAEEDSSQSEVISSAEQDELQTKEQLLQAKQALQAQLKQLEIEKQKLQNELQALTQAKLAKYDAVEATIKAIETKAKTEKASKEADKAKDEAVRAKALLQVSKAESEARKAESMAKQWEQWANSEAFKQWQKDVDKWAKEQAEMYQKDQEKGDAATPTPDPKPRPMPPMPAMPVMPVMPVMPARPAKAVAPAVGAPAPPAAPAQMAVEPAAPLAVPPMPVDANQAKSQPGEVLITEEFLDMDLVKVVLPTLAECAGMPIIADETVKGSITCTLVQVPLDKALQIVLAGTPYTVKKTPYYYLVVVSPGNTKATTSPDALKGPPSDVPSLGAPAGTVKPVPTPATPTTGSKADRDIKISKTKDNKYVATKQMQFASKVKPGSPFVVRNNLGNITLRPSKDDTCDVKAVIRAEAKTAAKAKELVEQVGMNIQSSDERYYLKPVKADGGQWSNLGVDFTIAVPLGVRPDIKTDLGNIDLADLKGDIKAITDLGSVKAVNTAGNVNLSTDLGGVEFIAPKALAGGDIKLATNMGDIKFTAPKDLSAKLQVETKMGSIESDLPLEVNKTDMFKRNAEGTIGAGQASINIATDMGTIRLKWQDESKP